MIVPQAQNAVELSMMENEVPVEVLAFSEGDDWIKAATPIDLHVDYSPPAMALTSAAAAATDDGEGEYDDEYPTQASATTAVDD